MHGENLRISHGVGLYQPRLKLAARHIHVDLGTGCVSMAAPAQWYTK